MIIFSQLVYTRNFLEVGILKKTIQTLLMGAASITLLGACTSAATGDNQLSESQQVSSQTEEVKEVTLEYWSSYSETEPQAQVLKEAGAAFEEENPGVTIDFTFNGRDNSKLLPTAVQSGQEIDMYDANAVNIINRFGNNNLELTDYFQQQYPATNGEAYIDYTLGSMVGLAEILGEGDLYYVPMNPQAFVFMYNKDIFEEAGIESAPTTWEEFLAASQKIKDAGYTPLTTDPNYATGILGYYLQRLKGEEWVVELVNDNTYEMWSDPAVLEAAKALEELGTKGYYAENITTAQFPQAQQEFIIEEDIAMYINGTWMPGEVKNSAREDFSWGQFAFPAVENGQDPSTHTAYSSYGIGINKDAEQEEADLAFEFAVFVNTGEFDQMMVDVANAIPVDPQNDYPAELEDMREIFETTDGRYNSQTSIATNSDNAQIIRSAVIKLLAGETTAEEFIAEIQNAG